MAIFFMVLLTSLWANNIYLIVLFSLLIYVYIPIKKYWDVQCGLLFVFSFIYSAMALMTNQYGSGFMLISYLIAPVAFYRFGQWLLSYFTDEDARQKLLLCIMATYLSPLIIMTFIDISLVGIVNESRVMLSDMSDGESLAATLYGLMASIGIGAIASLLVKNQKACLRWGYILLSLLSSLIVIHLVNRTGIVILLTCILVSFMISIRTDARKVFSSVILLCIIAVVLTKTGVITDDIINAYQQRELDSSVDAAQLGGRIAIWNDSLSKLLTHPLGWNRLQYAHNMWLDIGRIGGWISLFLFLSVTLAWVRSIIKLLFHNKSTFVSIIISVNVSIFFASFVEPVIDASILYFVLLLMIWGMTIGLSKEKRRV